MKSMGQMGYERYMASGPEHVVGKTFDGRAMPTWDELAATEAGSITRERWEASAAEMFALAYEAARTRFGRGGAT